jgi:glycine betaine/proline transport system ATP-binding protein
MEEDKMAKAAFHGVLRDASTREVPLPSYSAVAGSASAPRPAPKPQPDAGEVRLDVSNVSKIFADNPRPALEMLYAGAGKDEVYQKLGVVVGVRDASFQVRSGEIFVIMGLSGSGKSTMIRLLNRLIEPSAGKIVLDGRDLVTMPTRELIQMRGRKMSMVFQSFALMPHLTALDNAAFGLQIAGAPKQKRHEAAMQALEQVGLGQYAHRYPREMSGGMQQRVGLARALANNPTIMLMDEAFSALDPLIRAEMQDELLRLQRDYQRTIVFISHDLDEALRIGDRIAIMKAGSIVQIGTPYEILQDPADDYVRAFFRNVDISRVLRAGDVVRYKAADTVRDIASELQSALDQLTETGNEYGYVCDPNRRFQGIVSRASLKRALCERQPRFHHAFLPGIEPIPSKQPLRDVLSIVAAAQCPVPVIDDSNTYLGAISPQILLQTLDR